MKVIAITNQKGGVGKTTTAINLATTLVALKKKVLIIDLDGQGNASTGLGIPNKARTRTTYDVLMGESTFKDVILSVKSVSGLDISPANGDLSSLDKQLLDQKDRFMRLKSGLSQLDQDYDYVLIDCPPSLNILTLNALAASNSVLIPLQCEYFALEGLSQLMATVRELRNALNPALSIQGIVLTMYDKRNNLSSQVESDVRDNLGDMVYETVIPRNVRLSEAPSHAIPALLYDPKSAGSIAYQKMAIEFLKRENDTVREVA